MNSSSFGKFYFNIGCSEDIYGRYCIQKGNSEWQWRKNLT